MTEGIDFEALLATLEEERANLDKMIAWVKWKLPKADSNGAAKIEQMIAQRSEVMRFPRLKSDTFFKMSFPQAITECLNIMKRPMSARDITNALQEGGLTHKAKDLYQTVFPTLQRMKEKGEVDKLPNGDWGLAEWYRQKSAQSQVEEGK